MDLERIIDRVSGVFLWLYYRRWERWELIAIGIAALVILILIVRAHLKVAANERRLRERSPIIGMRMAGHRKRHY